MVPLLFGWGHWRGGVGGGGQKGVQSKKYVTYNTFFFHPPDVLLILLSVININIFKKKEKKNKKENTMQAVEAIPHDKKVKVYTSVQCLNLLSLARAPPKDEKEKQQRLMMIWRVVSHAIRPAPSPPEVSRSTSNPPSRS